MPAFVRTDISQDIYFIIKIPKMKLTTTNIIFPGQFQE